MLQPPPACRFFVNNNFLQDVGSKPLVFPEPLPELPGSLPSADALLKDPELASDVSDADSDADDTVRRACLSVSVE